MAALYGDVFISKLPKFPLLLYSSIPVLPFLIYLTFLYKFFTLVQKFAGVRIIVVFLFVYIYIYIFFFLSFRVYERLSFF